MARFCPFLGLKKAEKSLNFDTFAHAQKKLPERRL
jgi:hypothetical protein